MTIPYQTLGIDLGDGELGIYPLGAYYMDGGYSKEQVAAAGMFGTYANKVITFPVAKTVLLAIIGNDLYNASWSSAFKVENNLYK